MAEMSNELAEKLKVLDKLLTKLSFASTHKNDLHIAAEMGDEVSVITEILNDHPELAEELDSQKSSPLHIAAVKGHAKITAIFLKQAPRMCWSRDSHGMNPVHVAAVKGHADVLEKLVKEEPFAAVEKLDRGETALHLCVKHGHYEALEVLVKNLGRLNGVEDNYGETVLHWAVRYHDVKIIKYLMSVDEINEKSRNSKGQKALDLLKQSPWYKQKEHRALDIKRHLKSRSTIKSFIQKFGDPPKKDMRNKRDSVMVVAVLIATMAFTAVTSPPGGVWQENTPHKAGESVMAFNHPDIYRFFMGYNSLAFITSLTTILLLISGLPSKYRICMWTLTLIMWTSIMAIAIAYTTSVIVITPKRQGPSISHLVKVGIIWSLCVMGILFFLNSIRMWNVWAKKIRVGLKWLTCFLNPTSPHPV